MTDGPNIAEVAALVGDPARANMLVALMDGRALTAKGAGVRRRRIAADRERPSRQAGGRAPAGLHLPGPASLLPGRLAAGRAHAREHHPGGGDRGAAAPSAPLAARRRAAHRTHLLRSSRRPTGRRDRRRPGRSRGGGPERRRRRGHGGWCGVSRGPPGARPRPDVAVPSAAHVWTGASGDGISPARSAPRSPIVASRSAGSIGSATAAPWRSPPRGEIALRDLFRIDASHLRLAA
jgi:hypothetical protein